MNILNILILIASIILIFIGFAGLVNGKDKFVIVVYIGIVGLVIVKIRLLLAIMDLIFI